MFGIKIRENMTYICCFVFLIYIAFYFVWHASNSKDKKGTPRKFVGIPVDGLCTYGLSSPRSWEAWVGMIAGAISCCIMCSMVYFFYKDNKAKIHKTFNTWSTYDASAKTPALPSMSSAAAATTARRVTIG